VIGGEISYRRQAKRETRETYESSRTWKTTCNIKKLTENNDYLFLGKKFSKLR